MASLKDILVKIKAQSQFESAKKGIQQKLSKKVELSKVGDNLQNYREVFNDFNVEKQALYGHLDEVLNSSQTMIELNKELSKIYWIHDDLFNQAAELGVDQLLPEESIDIFNLDVAAGLGKIENALTKVSDFCIQQLQDEFNHDL